MYVKRVPGVLWLTLAVGLMFDVGCVGCWVAFIVADCNEGALAVSSAFTVFTGPLLAGTILLLCRRPSGMRWLRFGSVVFVCVPGTLLAIWRLKYDPAYLAYMSGEEPTTAVERREAQRRETPWHRGRAQGPTFDD